MNIIICENCHYDLTGLSATGRCPECGRRYSTYGSVGIRDRQKEAERFVDRLRTIMLVVIGLAIFGIAGLIELYRQLNGNPDHWITSPVLWTAGFITLLFFLAGLVSYVNETHKRR